jgi:glycosyltransferase involved in cell wall biosynthesis
VDVNYYMPYLLVNPKGLPDTKTVAWFTHKEERARKKAESWNVAAKAVSLRVAMSKKYERELARFGPSVTLPVPIDVHKFTPRKLRVGVAGVVYSTGRKGEELVRKLHQSGEFEVVGAGKGWPCPTKFYPWDRMQAFYQSLDVFLVTSEVEGGPVTMLEALACGVPVLAPSGVGFVDEFDVMLYTRGNYTSMVKRLRTLSIGKQARRKQVVHRTARNYAQAHLETFEALCAA